MDLKFKDDCLPQTLVGRSINTNSCVPASGGFHDFYRYIDDDKARAYNYGQHMLGPVIEMTVPTFSASAYTHEKDLPSNTKPRIFEGASDLNHQFFNYSPPIQSDPAEKNIPEHDTNTKVENIYIDINKHIISKPNVPIEKSLQETFIEYITPNKLSFTEPSIPGKSLQYPFKSVKSTFNMKKCNAQEQENCLLGRKAGTSVYLNPSNNTSSDTCKRERITPNINTYSPHRIMQRVTYNYKPNNNIKNKRSILKNTEQCNLKRNILNQNLSERPHNLIHSNNKQSYNLSIPEFKKVVKFAHEDLSHDMNDGFKKEMHTHPLINNYFQQLPCTERPITENTRFDKPDEIENKWPQHLQTYSKKNMDIFPIHALRDKDKQCQYDFDCQQIGKKYIQQTIVMTKKKKHNISLKKEEKMWPSSYNQSKTHINNSFFDHISSTQNDRKNEKISNTPSMQNNFILSYDFPNTHLHQTSRKDDHLSKTYRTPNGYIPQVSISQQPFHNAFDKSKSSNNQQFPYLLTHAADKSHIGVLNNRD